MPTGVAATIDSAEAASNFPYDMTLPVMLVVAFGAAGTRTAPCVRAFSAFLVITGSSEALARVDLYNFLFNSSRSFLALPNLG